MAVARDALPAAERLRITETFVSLQGEALSVGLPTFFIRLTGCPLRCHYCDTAYAFHGGAWQSVAALVAAAEASAAPAVCVTGGEPLAQPACLPLLSALCDSGLAVSLETSGALPIDAVDERVVRVVDFKTPGSGELSRNCWDNAAALRSTDVVKFVVTDRADFDWAMRAVAEYDLAERATVFVSPAFGVVAPADLAAWLLEAPAGAVRLQVQLHKLLWGDEPGH